MQRARGREEREIESDRDRERDDCDVHCWLISRLTLLVIRESLRKCPGLS